MLNGAMVSWASKRQPVTAISSTESEFYSVSLCGLDCVYLRRMMDMMGYKQIAILYTNAIYSDMHISPSKSATHMCTPINLANQFHWW